MSRIVVPPILVMEITPSEMKSPYTGQSKGLRHGTTGMLALSLGMDVATQVMEGEINEDMYQSRIAHKNALNSLSIVNNALGMGLLTGEFSSSEMMMNLASYILDSKVPEGLGKESAAKLKALGKWLFDNKDKILNDELPKFPNDDIKDSNYPLSKELINEKNGNGGNN